MKQLRIKMKHDEIYALNEWIEDLVKHEQESTSIAELCSLAVLSEWQTKKLKPKLYWIETRHSSYILQAPVILALLHFIGKSNEPVTTYRGYCLHNLRTIIYNVYQTTSLTT